MNKFPTDIKTVIFDLGGVLVDLSPRHTAQAFASMAGIPVEEVFKLYASRPEFNIYERGGMSDAEFRDFVRHTFLPNAVDDHIDTSWNAMLRGFPTAKLTMLELLKERFTTVLLSNTNAIHLKYIEDRMLPGRSLDTFFHHAFYSHLVKLRKPEVDIYKHVLTQCQLNPETTVFLDDNLDNLEGARQVGIHTIHIAHPDRVFELFKDYE